MPLLEETADLSNLSTGGLRNMQNPAGSVTTTNNAPPTSTNPQNQAGSVTTPTSVPGTAVTPPSTVDAILEAQNAGIIGTPQRRGTPGEKEIPDGVGQNRLPSTPPKPTPEVGQGVDYFSNENVKGFVTNTFFQRTDHVEPLRENNISRDSKGDPTRFQNNSNRRFTGQSSRLVNFTKPSFTFSNIERSGFVSLFDQNNLFTAKFPQSRLEEIGDANFFETYYSQVFDVGGLGITSTNQFTSRNLGFSGYLNRKLKSSNAGINILRGVINGVSPTNNFLPSFEVPSDRREPFVIRKIGERWGVDRFPKPELQGVMPGLVQIDKPSFKGKDVIDSFFNAIDDVGNRILGREPSVFLDRYFADVKRINGATNSIDFLTKGSRFVQAQSELQKRNPFDTISSTLYNLSDEGQIQVGVGDLIPDNIKNASDKFKAMKGKDVLKLNLDPKSYNPLSVFSVPGVLGINRNSFLDISSIASKGTIIDYISSNVYKTIQTAFVENIKEKFKNRKKAPKLNIGITGKDVRDKFNELAKNASDTAGLGNLDLSAFEFKPKPNPTAEKIVETTENFLKGVRKVAQNFELIPGTENAKASKARLSQINKESFSDKGVDRVNLIPYGKDRYAVGAGQELTLDELDWCPFKFKDVRNNKFITFRAILSGIVDTFSPEYSSERYVGRPDSVYVYQGTSREISFTFDVYPKSDSELITLWEKLNYLAGQTYPHWTEKDTSGGIGMISPFTELTIGQMYTDTPGYISSLAFNIMDTGTWETYFATLPKYIQVNCSFIYIGNRLPAATQKHYEIPWVPEKGLEDLSITRDSNFHLINSQARVDNQIDRGKFKKLLSAAGLG